MVKVDNATSFESGECCIVIVLNNSIVDIASVKSRKFLVRFSAITQINVKATRASDITFSKLQKKKTRRRKHNNKMQCTEPKKGFCHSSKRRNRP